MTNNKQPTTYDYVSVKTAGSVVSRKLYVVSFKGFSLAEIIVAAAIIAIGMAGILAAFGAYERAAGSAVPSVEAALLAEEGIEAAGVMRDNAWNTTLGTYTVNTPYMLEWKSSTWVATTSMSEIDSTYYRTITFGNVYRGANDQITSSGGTLDTKSRLVTVAVEWISPTGATSTVSLSAYMSNLFNN